MTQNEKRIFIRDLIEGVGQEILSKVPDMPEKWDGIELRQLIAEKFSNATHPRLLSGQRKSDYKNECIIRNL